MKASLIAPLVLGWLCLCTSLAQVANHPPPNLWAEIEKKIVWGDFIARNAGASATNEIQAGVFFNPRSARCTLYTRIRGTNSFTRLYWLYYPPEEHFFALELRDSDGIDVPKTELGRSQGQATLIPGKWSEQSRKGFLLSSRPDAIEGASSFDLTRYFDIKKAGVYELKVVVRLLQRTTNRPPRLEAFELPPVMLKLEWH